MADPKGAMKSQYQINVYENGTELIPLLGMFDSLSLAELGEEFQRVGTMLIEQANERAEG